jgi:NAD(P)-dependent dehydrogenase (short-subunit alcohol dehydrogenase family)
LNSGDFPEGLAMRLRNKVAVVTGGGSGLGAEICRTFARAGAGVAVTDLRREAAEQVTEEIRAAGGQALVWVFDVVDRRAVENGATEIEQQLGPIDIWVNNAGLSRVIPFLDCTDELWDLILQVNLKGTFIGCQTAIRRMLPRKRGVILNMSSQSGKAGNSHYAAYCASKFGVIGLTQSLALEFGRAGIRVNALCPGAVLTSLWDEQHQRAYASKRKMAPEDVEAYLAEKVPVGRLCTPQDVALTALFLVTDEAAFITGQAINITGGLVMH